MCSSMLLVVQSTMVTASMVRGSAPRPTTTSFVLLRSWAWAEATVTAATSSAASVATRNAIRMSSSWVVLGCRSATPGSAASSVLRRIRVVTLTPIACRPIITAEMSEHAFQQLMLGIVCGEVAVVIVAFLVFWYKTRKSLDQIEGISAAVYLEVKRTLREHRST